MESINVRSSYLHQAKVQRLEAERSYQYHSVADLLLETKNTLTCRAHLLWMI